MPGWVLKAFHFEIVFERLSKVKEEQHSWIFEEDFPVFENGSLNFDSLISLK
jgi:hypothetical protein